MSEDTTVAPSRFSILVPEPKTRLNLGKPEGGNNAFGYSGVSLQAEDHLFADVKKFVHLQAGKQVHLQSGDHWDQFAYKNMNFAANFNSTLGANGKVVVAAGAGQANFPTIPTGTGAPPWIDYNNLKLHYLIDTVSTGLKELFYGEHWRERQTVAGDVQKDWFKTQPAPIQDHGMLAEFDSHLTELGFDRTRDAAVFAALLTPMRWSPDFVSAQGKAMPWNWSSSEFKFLTAGDPYAASAVTGTGPTRVVTKFMAYVLQTGVLVRRLSDTLEALIPSIMEFEVIARIRGLVFAARSFNEAILKMDPKEWKKFDPKGPDNAWTQVRKHSWEPFEEGTWKTTRAELTSSPEPYQLSTCGSLELEILDKEGGTPKVLNLSALGTPATVTLTIEGKFTAIHVSATGDGTLTLDGTLVSYASAEKAWRHGEEEGLPEGFAFDAATGVLTKEGELFAASAPSETLAFEDRTFSTGSIALVVDGTPHAVPGVAALNAVGASARAAALAGKLGGIGGVTATASGHTVTVTSPTLGANASLALSTSVAAHGELGLEGEASGGGASLSAHQLKELLEGKGNYTAELQGEAPHQWLEVKHNVEGKESYLEFAGEPAKVFFGKNPASAKGTDPTHSPKDMQPLFDALFETMEGNSINALFRPVLDAMQQVVEVWTKIEDAMKGLKAAFMPEKAKPHLALTAGLGGVTLATNGPVTEVGHSVTLIAAGKMTEVNEKKFIPLVEDLMHGVEVLSEKLDHALFHNPFAGSLVPEEHGNLNFISSGMVNLIAKDSVRVMSGMNVAMNAANVAMDAAGAVTLAAHGGGLLLKGPTIQIGDTTPKPAGLNAQKPTTNVVVKASTGAVRVHTDEVGAWFDEGTKRAALGTRKTADSTLDETKVHLAVKPTEAKLGNNDAAVLVKAKNATLTAATKVSLVVDGKIDLEAKGGKVKIHGDLDVGGALTVKGIPVPTVPEVNLSIDAAAAATLAAMRAEYAALGAVVSTLGTAVRTANEAIHKVREDLVPMIPSAQAAALAAAEAVRDGLVQQLAALDTKLNAVEAKLRGIDRADLVRPRSRSLS